MTKKDYFAIIEPLIQTIAQEIYDEHFGRDPHEKKSWYATDLGSCLRGVLLARLGKKKSKEVPDYVKNVAFEGKLKELELILRLALEEKEIISAQERLYNKELDISGRPDVIIRETPNPILPKPQFIVEEIKTVNSRSFWHHTKSGKGKRGSFEPYDHHILQMTFYLHELKDKYPGITGRLRYRSRDDGTEILIPVIYDERIWERIVEIGTSLNIFWVDELMPPLEPAIIRDPISGKDIINWKAKYCGYHDQCTGDPLWLERAEAKIKTGSYDQMGKYIMDKYNSFYGTN